MLAKNMLGPCGNKFLIPIGTCRPHYNQTTDIVGFATMIQFGSTNTLIQMMTPDRLRGRAISAYSMMYMGMTPIGSLAAGVIAEHTGARATIAAGGVLCLIFSGIYASQLSEIRDEARRMVLSASAATPEQIAAEGAVRS